MPNPDSKITALVRIFAPQLVAAVEAYTAGRI
jgi:hypothetical protein